MNRKEVENTLNKLLTHKLSFDQATDAIVTALFKKRMGELRVERDRLDSEMHRLQQECQSAAMRDLGRQWGEKDGS